MQNIKEKLRGLGDTLKNEAVRCEFISVVLLMALLLVPDTRLDVETSVIGNNEHVRINYGIFNKSKLVHISEAKESQMMEGSAINIIQCNGALQENQRKRKHLEEFDYIYGITTTAREWRYILLTSIYRTEYIDTPPLGKAINW